jgi:hypothetical protein
MRRRRPDCGEAASALEAAAEGREARVAGATQASLRRSARRSTRNRTCTAARAPQPVSRGLPPKAHGGARERPTCRELPPTRQRCYRTRRALARPQSIATRLASPRGRGRPEVPPDR